MNILKLSYISALAAAVSCQTADMTPVTDPYSGTDGMIKASCSFSGLAGNGLGADTYAMTKAPVGQTTAVALKANFLKWDEPYQDGATPATYKPVGLDSPTGWSEAYIVDATVSAPQNNSANFRSINMDPRQSYRTSGTEENKVGYITRMIGWYPATYDVPDSFTGEEGSNAKFSEAKGFYEDGNGNVYVEFNRLDLKTDIMMTEAKEGRVKLNASSEEELRFKNNPSDRRVPPFGHEYSDPLDYSSDLIYENYFTFRHYLTAIRLFAKADNSDLSLISWSHINNVVFEGQPSTVKIRIPDVSSAGTESSAAETLWSDFKDMGIVRDAMFTDDPGIPGFGNYGETAEYPISLDDVISMGGEYLGYALIKPVMKTGTETISVELHTDAGVFGVEIDPKTLDINFEAGHIYDIYIDIKTDDSINAVLENSDFMNFKNLAPHNEALDKFEYANCYVIDLDEDLTMPAESGGGKYAGFYFPAGIAGRGRDGLVEGSRMYPDSEYLDPYSVQILWQSEEYLITHAELVHGYVRFILNEKCYDKTLDGNAVIAVSDRSGNIIWSWHIWVVSGLEDVTLQGKTMMNMNLGATKAAWTGAGDVLETYGLYYQWGRKDPSPGPPSYDYSRQDMLTAEFVTNNGLQDYVMEGMYSQPTVKDAAEHPLVVIASTSTDDYPYDWLYYKEDDLWGAVSGRKTVYDPCPFGYRVANDELRTVFEYYKGHDSEPDMPAGHGSDDKTEIPSSGYGFEIAGSGFGHVYDGVYFPFAGWKGHDQGRTDRTHAWFGVGTHGDYQSARINGSADSRYDKDHRERNLILKNELFENDRDDNNNTPDNQDNRGYDWTEEGNWFTGFYNIYTSKSYEVLNVTPAYTTNITLDWANRTTAAPVRCVKYDAETPQQQP